MRRVEPLRRGATWRLLLLVATSGTALVAAAALGAPVLAAASAPLLLALGLAALRPAPLSPEVETSVEPPLAYEGSRLEVRVELRATDRLDRVDLALVVPPGLEPETPVRWCLSLDPGGRRTLRASLRAPRLGVYELGSVALALREPGRCLVTTGRVGTPVRVEVRAAPLPLRTLPRPGATRARAGDAVARTLGDGIEPGEVRPLLPGEGAGRLNWKATARHDVPCVTDYHPERSTDVVLFVDAFDHSSLPDVLGLATTVATAYLSRHDRVGLVVFGGVLEWVEPATGPAQRERVVRALSATEAFFSFAWKGAEVIPRRVIPPRALIVAVTPLEDARSLGALEMLAAERREVAVIEVEGRRGPPLDEGPTGPRHRAPSLAARVARRIAALEREERRVRFASLGIPVVTWRVGDPPAGALAALAAATRARRAVPRP